MQKNFMFNMPLQKFAYLTGRSLTVFKKDFYNAFATTPQRWMTKKKAGIGLLPAECKK